MAMIRHAIDFGVIPRSESKDGFEGKLLFWMEWYYFVEIARCFIIVMGYHTFAFEKFLGFSFEDH